MDDFPLKRCARCKQDKPATREYFSVHNREADHLYYICKECDHAAKRRPPKFVYIVPEGYKRCTQCGEIKPATLEYFYRKPKNRDMLDSWCKPCFCKKSKERKPRIDPERTHQRCTNCGHIYPTTSEYFYKSRYGVNGIGTKCKDCNKKEAKAWRNTHIDQARARTRQWQTSHKKHMKTYARQYYYTHLEQAKEQWNRYNKGHREEILRYRKVYYASHRDQMIARMRERRKVRPFPSDSKQYQRNYYRAHRDYYIAKAHRRRVMISSIPGTYTAQEVREQYNRQHGKCYYCRHKVKWGRHHLDHTFPVSRPFARNSIDHLVITCKSCNLRKGNKYPHEFPEGSRLL